MRIFFIASTMTFLCFRFFKTRANYFNKNFHEVLRAEKSFSYCATRIFINIFSLWSSFSLCSFFWKKSFFTMMIELIFIATDCELLIYCKYWRAISTRNNSYCKRIFVSSCSIRLKYIFFDLLKWIRSLFIN